MRCTYSVLFQCSSNYLRPQTTSSPHQQQFAPVDHSCVFKFGDELIPPKTVVDMNIGTNSGPMALRGRHHILVEPLFYHCDRLAKLTIDTTTFCFAVSDYTGFSIFREYNSGGVSSSLSQVTGGTSHANFNVTLKRTVLVVEARELFASIHEKNTTIHRLKLDMQDTN